MDEDNGTTANSGAATDTPADDTTDLGTDDTGTWGTTTDDSGTTSDTSTGTADTGTWDTTSADMGTDPGTGTADTWDTTSADGGTWDTTSADTSTGTADTGTWDTTSADGGTGTWDTTADTGMTADTGSGAGEVAEGGGGPAAAGTIGTQGGQGYTVYTGSLRYGGTLAWRNNNPGNIRPSQFTTDHGAIGKGFGFAIFPDEATGMAAIVALLKTATYQALTIKEAIFKYAPPNDNNDSAAYVAFIKKQTGLDPATPMKQLTDDNLTAVAGAIRQMEGWTPGTEYTCATAGVPAWVKKVLGCA